MNNNNDHQRDLRSDPREALRDAVGAYESAPEGRGHDVLVSQSQKVAWLVKRGLLDEREARGAFLAAGERRSAKRGEVDAAMDSALEKAAPAAALRYAVDIPKPAAKRKKPPAIYETVEAAEARISKWLKKPHRGTWDYCDASGEVVMAVMRFGDGAEKEFRPIHPRPGGGWAMEDPPGPLPLYNLPDLLQRSGTKIVVAEGEKCVDVLTHLNFIATTSSHGGNGAKNTDWTPMAGRRVAILPDNDQTGEKYAAAVRDQLRALDPPADVRVVRLPELPPKGDVVDWLEALPDTWDDDRAGDELDRLIEAAFTEPPPPEPTPATIPMRPSQASPAPIDWSAASDEDLGILPLSVVRTERVEWLWPNRLLRGAMNLVAGEGGLGKSQTLLHIAATISVGGEWPDGGGTAPLGETLILAAEDDPATTIKPRLLAMGADVSKIAILTGNQVVRQEGKVPVQLHTTLQNLDHWHRIFDRRPDTRLMIVDPLASYLGLGVNDSKNNELRAVLEPFVKDVIRPRGICLLANAHLNKSAESRNPIHRVNGSVAYANLARSVAFVMRDPGDPAHRLFSLAKCNVARDDLPSLRFHIEERTIEGDDGPITTAVPVFDAETVDVDISEAMEGDKGATSRRGRDPVKMTQLAEWLVDFMQANGNLVLAAKIFDAAGFAGHVGTQNEKGRWSGLNALYRAKDFIPALKAPREGWEVITSYEDSSLRSPIKGYAQWLLRPQGVAF